MKAIDSRILVYIYRLDAHNQCTCLIVRDGSTIVNLHRRVRFSFLPKIDWKCIFRDLGSFIIRSDSFYGVLKVLGSLPRLSTTLHHWHWPRPSKLTARIRELLNPRQTTLALHCWHMAHMWQCAHTTLYTIQCKIAHTQVNMIWISHFISNKKDWKGS
jgi:hypothetical protein